MSIILPKDILVSIFLLINTASALINLYDVKPFGTSNSNDLPSPILPCDEFFPNTKISWNGGNLISSKLKSIEYLIFELSLLTIKKFDLRFISIFCLSV